LKTIAVIPVHGRIPLLKITIQRLFDRNGVDHIICVGSEEERAVCNNAGAEFFEFANKPLGKKWNYGFMMAKKYNPEFIIYVGSSDWLSDNWIPVLLPLAEKVDMIGKPDFNMLHIGSEMIVANWPGYPIARRHEPIGIGRILNSRWLDKIGWRPFEDELNKSMDWCMCRKLKADDTCMMFNSPEIQSLSVSCEAWSNMHTSDFNDNVTPFQRPDLWLEKWFPEAFKLQHELS
jgi:hypothetical protein